MELSEAIKKLQYDIREEGLNFSVHERIESFAALKDQALLDWVTAYKEVEQQLRTYLDRNYSIK